MIQEKKILTMTLQLMALVPSTRPTPRTPPTAAWVVEIGRPKRVARSTTKVAAHCAQQAFEGVTSVMFLPIVLITCWPYMMRPITMKPPARKKTQMGISVFLLSGPSFAASTAPKGPTEFATSFAPWARLWNPAMTTTRLLNIISVFWSNLMPSSTFSTLASSATCTWTSSAWDGSFSFSAAVPASSVAFCASFSASLASRFFACHIINGYEMPAKTRDTATEIPMAAPVDILSKPIPLAPL
mmetsp:Transcript_72629/g.187341  ORF Transcript_72629/g.187341 Transcript_72629/m.187341 type:complete len:242 (-) Transcript_72629:811-1536(-)